jgi:hypothetical protein
MYYEKNYYDNNLLNLLKIKNKKYSIIEIKKFLLKNMKVENDYILDINKKKFDFLNLNKNYNITDNKIKVSIFLLIILENCVVKNINSNYLCYNYNDKPLCYYKSVS